MSVPSLPKAQWINRPADLANLVETLQNCKSFGIDTESNSLYAYQEQVCLMQISTPENDYLVDTLALPDLSAFGPIFANPAIEKIFHAAEYDIICLKRDFGFSFVNIFDTMLAARILGWQAIGLGAVLESLFSVTADKRFQRANWSQRPLSSEQLVYAQMDSHYLIEISKRLKADLHEFHRWELACEDFARLCATEIPTPHEEGTACWRIAGTQDLNMQQAAVLKELCTYRDQQARAANLPVFRIMGNNTLLQIALTCPQNRDQLSCLEGVNQRLIDRHGTGILRAIQRGLNGTPLRRPASPRPNDEYITRLEALRSWRKETGLRSGVESDIILPRDIMEAIAIQNPKGLPELAHIMASLPWRYQQYGDQILRIIHL